MSGYKLVLGMDRLPSYDSFAVAIADDGEIVHRGDSVSIDAIIKMANSHKVDAIALDNIFEIGDASAIRHFVSRLYGADLVGAPIDGAATLQSKVPNRRADPAAGQAVYVAKCAACHGTNGEGQRVGKA
ncbi:MAG TPA: c-type cytochrome, partial [Candidatus Methanomethylicus sp.]|nr:c-type cytochrome [Candidatus Methanomethylicus sp.]